VHGGQIDVIGVHMIGTLPGEFADCCIGRNSNAGRLRSDDGVLAVRLVPHRDYRRTALGSHHASAQLRLGLMGEAVSHANREFLKQEHDYWWGGPPVPRGSPRTRWCDRKISPRQNKGAG